MEVCLRQIACDVAHPGVSRQRATADLLRRDDDFTAIGLQDADGCAVEIAECYLRHATREKRNARALRPLGLKRLSKISEKEI